MSATCRNCAEPVSLNYCPRCGQEVDAHRTPFFGIVGDFFSEFFSLDGRHLRTALGIWTPGRLTEHYLAGKRASHVRPVRVYLVSSLVFFLLVGFAAPDAEQNNVFIDGVLVGRAEADPNLGNWELGLSRDSGTSELAERLQTMAPQKVLDKFYAGLERNIPAALIIFVPFLALAIKLLYLRKPFFYVEHLIFALHFQSFLFMALILANLVHRLGLGNFLAGFGPYLVVTVMIAPIYLALALKRVYQQSWRWTLLKTGALGVLYFLLLQPIIVATLYFVLRSM